MGMLNAGIVGCGMIRTPYLKACARSKWLNLVGCADLIEERAVEACEEATGYGCSQPVPQTYESMLDDGDIDIVINITNPSAHYRLNKMAIEAGKHVFVEKPHAIDPAGIQMASQALETAKEKGLGVLSGLQSRFQSDIRETIQRVQDGQIGDIVAIEEKWLRAPYFGSNFRHRPEDMREIEIQYGSQYRFAWLCGDDTPQTLVHNLDRAAWALGEMPPQRCHGLAGRSGEPVFGDVFDHHSVIYNYDNEVRVYAHCRTTQDCYEENSSVIMGTKGTAYVRDGLITGENPWQFEGEVPDPYRAEHREFFQSIRDGEPLHCGDYMTRSTLMTIMGQLSCYSGREIRWDEAKESDYCLGPNPSECAWEMDPPTEPGPDGVYPVPAVPGVADGVWPIAYAQDRRQ